MNLHNNFEREVTDEDYFNVDFEEKDIKNGQMDIKHNSRIKISRGSTSMR